MAVARGRARHGIDACGPAHRQDRVHELAPCPGPAAGRSYGSRDRRPRRHRLRGCRLAGGSRRRGDRAERQAATGPRSRGGDQGAAGPRGHGAGRTRGCDGRVRGRRDARARGPGAAAARRRDPQRRRTGRRRPRQPELGELRDGAVAEDARGLAPAPGDAGSGSRPVRPLLERCRRDGQSGPGQPRGRERLPGSARGAPPRPGAAGPGDRLGRLVGHRRGGGAAGTDRRPLRGPRRPLDRTGPGPQGARLARAS